jgi:hypothetical protein
VTSYARYLDLIYRVKKDADEISSQPDTIIQPSSS